MEKNFIASVLQAVYSRINKLTVVCVCIAFVIAFTPSLWGLFWSLNDAGIYQNKSLYIFIMCIIGIIGIHCANMLSAKIAIGKIHLTSLALLYSVIAASSVLKLGIWNLAISFLIALCVPIIAMIYVLRFRGNLKGIPSTTPIILAVLGLLGTILSSVLGYIEYLGLWLNIYWGLMSLFFSIIEIRDFTQQMSRLDEGDDSEANHLIAVLSLNLFCNILLCGGIGDIYVRGALKLLCMPLYPKRRD